jgi:hypothetical protein
MWSLIQEGLAITKKSITGPIRDRSGLDRSADRQLSPGAAARAASLPRSVAPTAAERPPSADIKKTCQIAGSNPRQGCRVLGNYTLQSCCL